MNTNSKIAVIYCRVSTEEQAVESESLSCQEKRCLDFAERNGYDIAEKFIERGESGRTAERTNLKKLLSYCFNKNNRVSAVICLKVDRFARNTGDFSTIIKALEKSNINVLFVEGSNDKNVQGNLLRNALAVLLQNLKAI